MTALTQQQLFDEIETLPIELKTKMIDTLLTSIHPVKKSIDTLWIQEVKKRKAQIDSGEATLVDGEEVFRKIASKYTL
ncbi:MAG TPA: addiction module protein [Saprospiraceae bacterium]|nr:addiction module protein [Saprospiraceae bacterium]